ncbi:MAG TPA: histidine triad nucleotide-binding protein [Thermomicrobiales bacterium]|nr:histidine triad nucleotide-binding protein [Thermomicrobiales bacterium]
MDENCIFCRIAAGELGTEFVAQSENAVAFDDIAPSAPVHVLVVPKRHISSLRDLDDPALAGELLTLTSQVAEEKGLLQAGYRVVTNDGPEAGQTVFHLHFHVLGGQKLGRMA